MEHYGDLNGIQKKKLKYGQDFQTYHKQTNKNNMKMKQLPDNSVDSIVADPPHGISFMAKIFKERFRFVGCELNADFCKKAKVQIKNEKQ